MMADYIKREDALEALKIARGYCPCAYEEIKNLPAADVTEVRHGRWIAETCESVSKRNRLIEYRVYKCSICGRSNGRIKKNYCPNCGAKMAEVPPDAQ